VVGAAAAHQVLATAADASSPAGKAAALARSANADDAGSADGDLAGEDEPKRKRHKGMLFLLLILVVGLVGGGGYAAYAWSQQQYFVGTDAGSIAIYKGLPQDVGPVHLSSVYERQDLTVDQLPSYWRDQVQQRITAPTLAKARAVVANLRDQAATCVTATPTTTPTATATPSGTKVTTTSTTKPTATSTSSAVGGVATVPPPGATTTPGSSPTTTPATGCGDG
jgi:protein phosphatase